jgi:hypothetical protein
MATKTTPAAGRWVMAREAVVVTCGARAPVYQTVIVRDNRTGQLAEVPLAPIEAPPIDEGDEGRYYAFRKHEKVEADHPAVLESPGSFIPFEE